ncbi:MAG: class II aldolase/adducin family protein [Burkholderiaceae bacterium]
MNTAAVMDKDSPEWKTREDLAACYRMVAHFGVEDLTYNHISARVPGEDALLVKPMDFMFREVTASSLLKYGLDGSPLGGTTRPAPNPIQVLHSAVMLARADVFCVIHSHSVANVAVSVHPDGLLPLSQHAYTLHGKMAIHAFGGYEFDLGMAEPLLRDLGSCTVVVLRNHGVLVAEKSIPEAFVTHHFYDMACRIQVAALAGGVKPIFPSEAIQAHGAKQVQAFQNATRGNKDWPACIRLANALYPGYRD